MFVLGADVEESDAVTFMCAVSGFSELEHLVSSSGDFALQGGCSTPALAAAFALTLAPASEDLLTVFSEEFHLRPWR